MKKFNPHITKQVVKDILKKIDNDGNGRIYIDGKFGSMLSWSEWLIDDKLIFLLQSSSSWWANRPQILHLQHQNLIQKVILASFIVTISFIPSIILE